MKAFLKKYGEDLKQMEVERLAADVINRYGRMKNPMPWQKELLEIARKIIANKLLTT